MKNLISILTIVVFLFSGKNYAGGFEDLGYSARAVALGGCGIALHGSPYSMFYNPANIFSAQRMSFYTTYSNLVPGIEDDNISYFTASGVIPINILGTVGAGGTFLNSEMWKEYTLNGTYALELYHGLSIGGAFKFMGWSASAPPGEDALSYSGFTVDVGAIYTMPEIMKNIDLQIGAAFNNLNNPSIAKSGANSGKLPVKMGLGLALVSNEYNYLFTADIVKESNVYTIKSGVEFNAFKGKMWGYSTDFVIRLGYLDLLASDFAKERALSGGIGIQVDNYRIDYAYRFPFILENLNGSHKISLSFIL